MLYWGLGPDWLLFQMLPKGLLKPSFLGTSFHPGSPESSISKKKKLVRFPAPAQLPLVCTLSLLIWSTVLTADVQVSSCPSIQACSHLEYFFFPVLNRCLFPILIPLLLPLLLETLQLLSHNPRTCLPPSHTQIIVYLFHWLVCLSFVNLTTITALSFEYNTPLINVCWIN